ncbi:MAG: T9SS type A sorting domain-containing protein [Candidatus Marinimicrobia bacterium]|nr:T9SS type A sorting domain-containing protein [Candidatus Neomarinimicrobiota bacterium]
MCPNYPNPFNPRTTLEFALSAASEIVLEIYNIRGERVDVLLDEHREAGNHRIGWEPQGLPSGCYLYMFRAGNVRKMGKMVYLK